MEMAAIFGSCIAKGLILMWWEARKLRRATPSAQIVTIRKVR